MIGIAGRVDKRPSARRERLCHRAAVTAIQVYVQHSEVERLRINQGEGLGDRRGRCMDSSQRRFSIGRRRAASHGITPVEHDDDSEHCPSINDLRYVIQNNSDALSAGVPKFFMSVARQYRHQA